VRAGFLSKSLISCAHQCFGYDIPVQLIFRGESLSRGDIIIISISGSFLCWKASVVLGPMQGVELCLHKDVTPYWWLGFSGQKRGYWSRGC
jgi:hypothetical protein